MSPLAAWDDASLALLTDAAEGSPAAGPELAVAVDRGPGGVGVGRAEPGLSGAGPAHGAMAVIATAAAQANAPAQVRRRRRRSRPARRSPPRRARSGRLGGAW